MSCSRRTKNRRAGCVAGPESTSVTRGIRAIVAAGSDTTHQGGLLWLVKQVCSYGARPPRWLRGVYRLFFASWVMQQATLFGADRLGALSAVESGGNDKAIGRRGEVSRYQILPVVWKEYARPGMKPHRMSDATEVTLRIMADRVRKFYGIYNRLPTDTEWYGLWNAPAQLLNRRGMSPVVYKRASRFANLVTYQRPAVAEVDPRAGHFLRGPRR